MHQLVLCPWQGAVVCMQISTLDFGDSAGVQQLQLAPERLQTSSSSPGRAEPSVSPHQLSDSPPKPSDAAAHASSLSPAHSPHQHQSLSESPTYPPQTPSSSSAQNPFPDAAVAVNSFQPAADPWDPWAEGPNHHSSSPHYLPGSSDSDWDELHDHSDHPEHNTSAEDQSSHTLHAGQEEEAGATRSSGQQTNPSLASVKADSQDPGHSQNPRVRSAMAEAQHVVDQLAGLAATYADIQDTLARKADLGYAWGLMGGYTQHFQRQVCFRLAIYTILHKPFKETNHKFYDMLKHFIVLRESDTFQTACCSRILLQHCVSSIWLGYRLDAAACESRTGVSARSPQSDFVPLSLCLPSSHTASYHMLHIMTKQLHEHSPRTIGKI